MIFMNFKDKLREMYAVDHPYRESFSLENGNDYRDSLDSEDLKGLGSKEEISDEFDELFEPEDYARPSGKILEGDEREPHRRPGIEIPSMLTGTFSAKLDIIREGIHELDAEIKKRKELAESFANEVDRKIKDLEFQLRELERFWIGNNLQPIEFRRLGLERDLLVLKREIRAERLRAWEHIDQLIRQRRELLNEYKTLLHTRKILGDES